MGNIQMRVRIIFFGVKEVKYKSIASDFMKSKKGVLPSLEIPKHIHIYLLQFLQNLSMLKVRFESQLFPYDFKTICRAYLYS